MKTKSKNTLIRALFFVFLGALLAVEISYATLQYNNEIYLLMSRLFGGCACMIFMIDFSITKILFPLGNKKLIPLLRIVPAFIIAINNFPFVSFFSGDCFINAGTGSILLFALSCFCTGFFEEMAFRGCAFMLLLKKRTQSRAKIFLAILLSSVVFGVIHFVNVFFGVSPAAVLMQIGYSALIGALCSLVLLLTRNIWLCVILHATYNFCGGLIDLEKAAESVQWTSSQMIFTAVVAVIVAIYFVILFFKMPISLGEDLFDVKPVKNQEETQKLN